MESFVHQGQGSALGAFVIVVRACQLFNLAGE
jgi:hypothetical protein